MMFTNFELCIICQEETGKRDYTNYTDHPTGASIDKTITCATTRVSKGEFKYKGYLDRANKFTKEQRDEASYHRSCYASLTNLSRIETAGNTRKRGRPSKDGESASSSKSSRSKSRSSADGPLDKNKCIFCQEVKDDLSIHEVTSENIGRQLMIIQKYTTNETLRVRLAIVFVDDDPLAAVAYDLKYHLRCFIERKRETEQIRKAATMDTVYAVKQLMCDSEIIDMIENTLDSGLITDMNEIQKVYISLLQGYEIEIPENRRFKPYLKDLILERIPDVHFNRPRDKKKSEQVMSTIAKESIVTAAVREECEDDIRTLMKAVSVLRNDIEKSPKWRFDGSFDGYTDPPLLLWFCKHLVKGTGSVKSDRRNRSVNIGAKTLSQHIVQGYRSKRQVKYQSSDGEADFRQQRETPLAWGIALDLYKNLRSKVFIDKMEKLDLSISYNKLLEATAGLANVVAEKSKLHGGCCLPPWLTKEKFVWFALDNVDFLEQTPCGNNTLHATALAVYQSKFPDGEPIGEKIKIKRTCNVRTIKESITPPLKHCKDPEPREIKLKYNFSTPSSNKGNHLQKNLAWLVGSSNIGSSNEDRKLPGTWNAFNSLLSDMPLFPTNVAIVSPLLRSPPTSYSTLYTGLMIANDITIQALGPNHLTIITFDMQLYDMAMKLWVERADIREKFLFRPGELHVVFWSFAALGKYIEGGGIDLSWSESGIYKSTTISKILNGKHLYRALEAHFVTMLALIQLMMDLIFQDIPNEDKVLLSNASMLLVSAYEKDVENHYGNENLSNAVGNAMNVFEKTNIVQKIEDFIKDATGVRKYLANYLLQYETILNFIRASRERNFRLHLESIEALIKYFFAHDHLSYGRFLPLYIATMQKTEKEHPEVWKEFTDGNFCVSKSMVEFTSIGPDHAIEHENRKLKVLGGIIGLTQNEKSLEKFFLITPLLSKLVTDFEERFGIYNQSQRTRHHDLTGGKLKRQTENASKLVRIIEERGNPFERVDDLCNFITEKIVDEKIAKQILERDQLGEAKYKEFVCDRIIEGKSSVWSKLTKLNIGTFRDSNCEIEIKDGDKVVKVKEERGLLQRLIVVSRSRPELNLEKCIGEFEFGLVPRSLFAADGTLLLANDKYKIREHLENMIKKENIETEPVKEIIDKESTCNSTPTAECPPISSTKRVIIIDGMALLNSLEKVFHHAKLFSEFANAFLQQLILLAKDYEQLRLVFDRYIDSSLKEQTRNKRMKKTAIVRYHVKDHTIIEHLKLKQFLSHPKTKEEVIRHLTTIALNHSRSNENNLKEFMVTADTETQGNIRIDINLKEHDHEEADTLLLLHASSLTDETVHILAQDTDVLLLMINFNRILPPQTYFYTGNSTNRRQISIKLLVDMLGTKRSEALLGFHAFTGADTTGKFALATKDRCFKMFMSLDDDILDALTSLGKQESLPDAQCLNELERFVCILYKQNTFSDVSKLRWFLYSNRQMQGENLPPTRGALLLHLYRAHYVALIWKRSLENKQYLPEKTLFGWEVIDGKCTPRRNLNLPAPKGIIELVKCGCSKGCSNRCSCHKNNLKCTEMCKCDAEICNNREKEEFVVSIDDDEELDD